MDPHTYIFANIENRRLSLTEQTILEFVLDLSKVHSSRSRVHYLFLHLTLRDLTCAAWLKSCKVTILGQNPSVHTRSTIFFPSTFKKPKSANFWMKIIIPNHCKSSGSKFVHSSIIRYNVMYHLNSSHFAGCWCWFVCNFVGHRALRKLTCARVKCCVT